ncbi:MAG TPA: outer-membrane lipoprotein carrier protein LolA [Hyphomicrobiaceae bacterium]|nr:outer-membrane lipoprotein carrier protein LolA [Hyphomicrobiaceae bacterium]
MIGLGLFRYARLSFGLSAAVGLVLVGLSGITLAQEAKKEPSNPVGGGTWNAKVNPDASAPAAGPTLDAKQMELVNKVSAYFNQLDNLKGAFVQTGADNKRMRGRFFLKRPGRLRFEYALPSKQLIVSDGQMVAIQDFDINTDDRITLDQTPFRVLLRKDVDLLRDARILDAQESEDLAVITLQDKSPDAPGKIKLFLSKLPQLELKEWVTTDAQGLDTRIEVSGLVKTEEIDVALFKITSPQIQNLQKNQ